MSTYAYAAGAPNLYDDADGLVLPAMAIPAAMAYGRCFGQCVAFATAAEVIDYGADCVNGPGILKNCAIECMNPLNYIGVGKILKAVKKTPKKSIPPTVGPPNGYVEGPRRSREYGPDGRPVRDYDRPHQGAQYDHVHEWPNGVREEDNLRYSPVPRR
jgi:hypothetical protein